MSEQVATATPMEADGAAPATETKEEAEPVPEDGLDVLLLMPGFAGSFDGPRAQYLRSMGHKLELIECPPPTSRANLERGVAMLQQRLAHGKPPDVLLASDEDAKGGDYVEQLVERNIYAAAASCSSPSECILGSYNEMCDVNAPPQWKNLYTKNEPEAAAAPPPEMAE
ncbi:hypothetical protein JL721_8596 [Aureococcus anophagefferens]|nr:hypothetical protein JL721_8596 [Aureococcus anophagefferens]